MEATPPIDSKHTFFLLAEDMRSLSTPLLTHLGITYFAFKRTFNDGSKIYLFNNADYYAHYFSQGHYLVGNREGNAKIYKSSYDLWDYLPDPRGLYNEASEQFNISHGLTITRKHEEYCDFFFFATTRDNSQIKRIYLNRREALEKFCDHFLIAGKNIIASATREKVILPYQPNLHLPPSDIFIDDFLKNISASEPALVKLTTRELDCARYLIHGKTNKEIAKELKISPRTVEEYINNLRQKFSCKSKAALISLLCNQAATGIIKITNNSG